MRAMAVDATASVRSGQVARGKKESRQGPRPVLDSPHMASKKKADDDDADLLSDSQFDLESDPGLRKSSGSRAVLFLVISLIFAAGVAVAALYSLELGPFAPPPPVETTIAQPETVEPTPTPASAPAVLPPLPKPSVVAEKVVKEEPPVKGKKGKKAKKAAKKKKKKK